MRACCFVTHIEQRLGRGAQEQREETARGGDRDDGVATAACDGDLEGVTVWIGRRPLGGGLAKSERARWVQTDNAREQGTRAVGWCRGQASVCDVVALVIAAAAHKVGGVADEVLLT